MRFALISRIVINAATLSSVLVLSGCGTLGFGKKDPLPVQPDAPTSADNMTIVGKQQDKVDGRVAAAVTVANRHADNPAIVKAETSVALSYLPVPSEKDVQYAERRSAKMDMKEYEEAVAYGKRFLEKLNNTWDKMEADRAEAKLVSDLKDKRIAEQEADIAKLRKDVADAKADRWTLAGILLAVIGGLAMAFGSPKAGVGLLFAGFAIGVFAILLGTPWFLPSVAGLSALAGIVAYFKFVRKPNTTIPTPDETPKT